MPRGGNYRKITDEELIRLFPLIGAGGIARQFNMRPEKVYKRRRAIEERYGQPLDSPSANPSPHSARLALDIPDGVVLVGSDAHLWPGALAPAMRAFVKFVDALRPKAIVLNGDVMDFPSVSRHPPIGWERLPEVHEEISFAQETLAKIESTARRAKLIWTLGNHDQRFETRLATVAPEYRKVFGVHLRDSFPKWSPCWSAWLNSDVVIKHRFKGGIHATHNNTLWSGKTTVTGHLHSLKVTPHSDYNGTRWGVDTGTLALVDGPQFVDYTEDNPRSWRSGFVVLTFFRGRLLWPEVVHVIDDSHVEFRGRVERI